MWTSYKNTRSPMPAGCLPPPVGRDQSRDPGELELVWTMALLLDRDSRGKFPVLRFCENSGLLNKFHGGADSVLSFCENCRFVHKGNNIVFIFQLQQFKPFNGLKGLNGLKGS